MPYISFKTTKILTQKQELDIKTTAGKLIEILPGKTENYLMIHIEDNQLMYFKGKEEDCMMITCKVYGKVGLSDKEDFVRELIKEVSRIAKIPSDDIYLTFSEYDHWGMFGEFV